MFNGLKNAFGLGGNDPEPVAEPDEPTPAEAEPLELDVVGYAEDCVLSGRLALAGGRLSDVLNAGVEFTLTDVSVADLLGNAPIELAELVVQRDDLLLVQSAGPRGDPTRRSHTRQHPVVVRIGPYEVRGLIHALPGTHPIDSLRRRRPMVALTDATIDFSIGLNHETHHASVVILNRELMDSVVEAFPDEVATPNTAADKTLVSA